MSSELGSRAERPCSSMNKQKNNSNLSISPGGRFIVTCVCNIKTISKEGNQEGLNGFPYFEKTG
jgi:methyl coenzyme M reductase subunit C